MKIHRRVDARKLGHAGVTAAGEVFPQQALALVTRGRRERAGRNGRETVEGDLAGGVVDANLAAQGLTERLDQSHLSRGRDVRAAAAAIEVIAAWSDHGDPAQLARVERKDAVLVLEQDETLPSGHAIERAMLERIGAFRAHRGVLVEMERRDHPQLPADQVVERPSRDAPLFQRRAHGGRLVHQGRRHFQVHTGVHGGQQMVGGAPIGHDQAPESPVPSQNPVE